MLSVINPSQYVGGLHRSTTVGHNDLINQYHSGYGTNISANIMNGGGSEFGAKPSRKSSSSSSSGSSSRSSSTSSSNCFMPNSSELYYMSAVRNSRSSTSSTSNASSNKPNFVQGNTNQSRIAQGNGMAVDTRGRTIPSTSYLTTAAGPSISTASSTSQSSQPLFHKPWNNSVFHPGYRSLPPTAASTASSSTGAVSSTSSGSRSMIASLSNSSNASPWITGLSTPVFATPASYPPTACNMQLPERKMSFAGPYSQSCRVQEMEQRKRLNSMSSGMASRPRIFPVSGVVPKEFSKPLFVDCSIEYELPNAPKIPKNSEPILMIYNNPNKLKSAKKEEAPMVRKTLSPKRNLNCDYSKKLNFDFLHQHKNENCSKSLNVPPMVQPQVSSELIHFKKDQQHHHQLSCLYQHQHFVQQQIRHQQQLQQQAVALHLKKNLQQEQLDYSPPRKQPKMAVAGDAGPGGKMMKQPPACFDFNCQCYEAVNYRRRLLHLNNQMQMKQHQHQFLNNNNIINGKVMPAPPQHPMKRSYAEAMLMDPAFLYEGKGQVQAHLGPLAHQHHLYGPASKQGRFSLY